MTFFELKSTITRKEKVFYWLIILFLVVITSLPYLYGWLVTPDGYFYTGEHRLSPADFNVYYSYMEQVAQGKVLFRDLFTSEFEPNNFFSPIWLLGGVFVKLGLSVQLVFQILRIAAIPFLGVVLYWFIAFFLKEPSKRKTAYIISLFGAGLGLFVFAVIGSKGLGTPYNYPLDIWVAEYNTFLTAYQTSHFIISLALILLVFLFMMLAFGNKKIKYSLIAGTLAFALFSFHPYHFVTIFAVLAAWFLFLFFKQKAKLWPYLKHLIILGLFSLPPLLYYLWLWSKDEVFRLRDYANNCLTPDWWITFASYGLVLVLAVLSLLFFKKNWQKYGEKFFLLILWAVVQFILIFAPFISFQRRLTEGLFIPLSILAAIGIFNLKEKIEARNKAIANILKNKVLLFLIFILFFFLSNLYIYLTDIIYFKNQVFFLYLPQEVKEASLWAKKNTVSDDIFLTSCFIGNYFPSYSGRIVYCGHGNETNFYDVKKNWVSWFFEDNYFLEEKLNFLKENKISYILLSDYPERLEGEDKIISPGFIKDAKYFRKVFDKNGSKIYQVVSYDYGNQGCNCSN